MSLLRSAIDIMFVKMSLVLAVVKFYIWVSMLKDLNSHDLHKQYQFKSFMKSRISFYVCCYLAFLTLNMLNCFKDYKRYIHIFNYIFDLTGRN